MTAPNLAGHALTVQSTHVFAECECGTPFRAKTYAALVEAWVAHVVREVTFGEAAQAARVEHDARLAVERHIVALSDAGVATAKIAEALGRDAEGTLLMSPTSVQRIVRAHRAAPAKKTTPRRRRK